jgi:hypothetical protein
MSTNPAPFSGTAASATPLGTLAERLERGEVIYYPVCPFALPQGEDRKFLLEQQLGGRVHKNIGFDPAKQKVSGYSRSSSQQEQRLQKIFVRFSQSATEWLAGVLPRYAKSWRLDRVSFRPLEESTRKLRMTARNDLLHVDSFPSRPTNGHRILRLFANVNPTEPRVWITSDPFPKLFERFGKKVGLPGSGAGWMQDLVGGFVRLFRPGKAPRSPYDSFMLRFHNFLKGNVEFQERCAKRLWSFPPGSAWMALTDTCSHAALRGRFALEHSYFVTPQSLALPELAPAAVLEQACGTPVLLRAA